MMVDIWFVNESGWTNPTDQTPTRPGWAGAVTCMARAELWPDGGPAACAQKSAAVVVGPGRREAHKFVWARDVVLPSGGLIKRFRWQSGYISSVHHLKPTMNGP